MGWGKVDSPKLTQLFSFLTFDPRGRPPVTGSRYHYLRTCCLSVRPSVRPYVRQKSGNTKQSSSENSDRYLLRTVGLAEWIIDDTHVLPIFFLVQLFPFRSASLSQISALDHCFFCTTYYYYCFLLHYSFFPFEGERRDFLLFLPFQKNRPSLLDVHKKQPIA